MFYRLQVALCGLIIIAAAGLVWAQQPTAPSPAAHPPPQAPPTAYPKTGVKVNNNVITPGEDMQFLLGIAGPPDHVAPVRGKEQTNDYVRFSYTTYGFSIRIKSVNNENNIVDSIVILQNNVQMVNVPFKVGDDYKAIMKIWGQPDQQEPGFMAYWKRGVYISVTTAGQVTGITLAEPGHFDASPAPKKQGAGA